MRNFLVVIMATLCLGFGVYKLRPDTGYERQQKKQKAEIAKYEQYLKEWNDDVMQGIYRQRINDEVLVYSIEEDSFKYTTRVGPNHRWKAAFFYENDFDFKQVILIDTESREIITKWIKADLIKPVHSNWGLTQDVWTLDKRISDLEKRKECAMGDNPLKTKREE